MTRPVESKRLRDLIRLLGGLQKLHGQLRSLVEVKIDAMKRADIAAMGELSRQEQTLAERLATYEESRRRLMEAMGEELGLSSQAARAITVSQLASRLSQPQRSLLRDAAGKLREVASQVAQANRVAGVVSREILNHLKFVFASVRPKEGQPVGYCGDGAPVGSGKMQIFETVA